MNTNDDYNAYKFWKELPTDERVKFLSENNLWDGLSNYLYEYLPEDVKTKIMLKIA